MKNIQEIANTEDIRADSPAGKIYEPLINGLSSAASYISRHPNVSIMFIGVMFSLPLIIYGYSFNADDTVYHSLYYKNFSAQLWSGDVYPRWLNNLNGGYGGPIFFFYPPIAYYVTSIFHPLELSVLSQLGLSAATGLVLSGLTAYLWLKEISTPGSALLSTIMYLLMPYYVYDIYGRGALAESFTFVWMPLILFFVVKVTRGSRFAIAGLAASYALLCTTHLLTVLMFSAIPLAYALILTDGRGRIKTLATIGAGMALGGGLSAAYVLPALTYQKYVYIEELTSGSFSFAKALLTTQLAIDGSMRYFWFIVVIGSVSFCCFFSGLQKSAVVKRTELIFWFAIASCSCIMMIYISYPIWLVARPLQMLQFPWRFNAILCIAALPLLAAAISSIKRPFTWPMRLTVVVISLFGIYSASYFSKCVKDAFSPPTFERYAYADRIDRLSLDWHAFWPISNDHMAFDRFETTLSNAPHSGAELTKAYLVEGAGTVNVQKWESRLIELHIHAPDGGGINVSQFCFPGWKVRETETLEELPLTTSPDAIASQDALALLYFTVPPGDHTVRLTLEKLWPEYLGQLLSGISAVLTLTLLTAFLWFAKRPGRGEAACSNQ